MAELATIARPYAEALFKASAADLSGTSVWLDELAAIAQNAQLLQFADSDTHLLWALKHFIHLSISKYLKFHVARKTFEPSLLAMNHQRKIDLALTNVFDGFLGRTC